MPRTFHNPYAPATARQKLYLQERGIEIDKRLTVSRASELIAQYQEDNEEERHIHDVEGDC